MEANLLVTYEPAHKGSAEQEAKALLEESGAKAEFLKSDTEGLFLVHTSGPKAVVKKLREICEESPEKFANTYRWVPIEKWTASDVSKMASVIKELVPKIGKNEKWKMELAKRHYDAGKDLIIKLTEPIDRPNVDLKNPEKIVQVEIIGKKAGISLLRPDEVLNAALLKR